MEIRTTEFQERAEKAIVETIEKEGFAIGERRTESVTDEVELFLHINNMEVLIAPDTLEFSRDGLLRSLERYDGIDEDRAIADFCGSLVHYLHHPEYQEVPSLRDLKGTFRWLMLRFGTVLYPDIPSKRDSADG